MNYVFIEQGKFTVESMSRKQIPSGFKARAANHYYKVMWDSGDPAQSLDAVMQIEQENLADMYILVPYDDQITEALRQVRFPTLTAIDPQLLQGNTKHENISRGLPPV